MILETPTIEIPDFKAGDIVEAFVANLAKTQDEIFSEIEKLSRGNDREARRIESSFLIYARRSEHGAIDNWELPFLEGALSLASASCIMCLDALGSGSLADAFSLLAQANQCLGMARGGDSAEAAESLKKKIIQQKAATKRHAENREYKAEAIAYYVENFAAKINELPKKQQGAAKDDAALELRKQVPIRLRTARKYIDEYHKSEKTLS